jgi:hypothetical protein
MHKVRYRGSPSSVAVLDSLLRNEGLTVEHREIVERDGGQHDIVDVVIYVHDPNIFGVLGSSPAAPIEPRIETALAKLRVSVPRAQAHIVATHNGPRHARAG